MGQKTPWFPSSFNQPCLDNPVWPEHMAMVMNLNVQLLKEITQINGA